MTAGYAGKILSINLTNKSFSVLDTEKYEEFGGGNGMGSALFWETCQEKAKTYHEENGSKVRVQQVWVPFYYLQRL